LPPVNRRLSNSRAASYLRDRIDGRLTVGGGKRRHVLFVISFLLGCTILST
jgi:hypothetical protein